ncbi:thioredoxin family protein [Candidatus Nitrosocosmicus franklandus]|uniref:Thiol-disulfide oxidoreductase YkuV n=1 Tax=Candidatus Nitrosocosmicus franklandianus TaxID=1798806 RepID=A0A484I9L7_9ARCH|nr:thioredoxin family protein [Candidatus Nitrosocosmicus franklandus]VFJ13512.1 Thiol-disulfide oxidoreductase YkuV [Candidatus Nitrosocosmicus franklandus]
MTQGKITRSLNRDNLSAILTAVAVISLIVGFGIYFNYFSSPSQSYLQQKQLEDSVDNLSTKTGNIITVKLNKTAFTEIDKSNYPLAPELQGITAYINTENGKPITLADLRGSVVLFDFWTYTCINCIRTIPYLNEWYDRYGDQGFVILGVHSPEFDFEKNIQNVQNAVNEFGIKYPIVLDSDHKTWNAYKNNYWPRHYLIDSQGYIREDHIGEGGYNETEKTIQTLLAEKAALENKTEISFDLDKGKLTNESASPISQRLKHVDFSQNMTPEIYLGYQNARSPLGNSEGFQPNKNVSYKLDTSSGGNSSFIPNLVYLDGTWKNNADNVELVGDKGKVILTYYAKSINIVASGDGQKLGIKEFNNKTDIDNGIKNNSESAEKNNIVEYKGLNMDSTNRALDLDENGNVIVDQQRLYNVGLYDDYQPRSIILDIEGSGFKLYTFTFG